MKFVPSGSTPVEFRTRVLFSRPVGVKLTQAQVAAIPQGAREVQGWEPCEEEAGSPELLGRLLHGGFEPVNLVVAPVTNPVRGGPPVVLKWALRRRVIYTVIDEVIGQATDPVA